MEPGFRIRIQSGQWILLYGGLGIGKLQFLIKKLIFILAVIFFQFLVIKALNGLDPDWSPASNAGSGSGKNEYGSETLHGTFMIRYRVRVQPYQLLKDFPNSGGDTITQKKQKKTS
jgi:hypothetical protein